MAARNSKKHDETITTVHRTIYTKDHSSLSAILSGIMPVADPTTLLTESAARTDADVAFARSTILDYRDPDYNHDTPLHLAVRMSDPTSVRLLMKAGADPTVRSPSGWSPLDEAVASNNHEIIRIILEHRNVIQCQKWARCRPVVINRLSEVRDFYAEIHFGFESSMFPFVSKIGPSDLIKVWKIGSNLRVDTTLDGFELFKNRRAESRFMFLGGSLCVVSCGDRTVRFFDGRREAASKEEIDREVADLARKQLTRTGIDIEKAQLLPVKDEKLGPWESKMYKLRNAEQKMIVRRPTGLRVSDVESEPANCLEEYEENIKLYLSEQELKEWKTALELDSTAHTDDDEQSVADHEEHVKKPKSAFGKLKKQCSKLTSANVNGYQVMKQKFARKSVGSRNGEEDGNEVEYKMKLKADVWLSEIFPLRIKELLQLLNVFGEKVKIVRKLIEVLNSKKIPPGTFPVKVSFPITLMSAIKVNIQFMNFKDLAIKTDFMTPPSTPPLSPLNGGLEAQDVFRIPPEFTII